MRPQNAILRASVEKDEDPAVSTGGALYGPVGKTGSSLERGGRLQEEQEARRVSKWSLEGVQPTAHLSTQKTGRCWNQGPSRNQLTPVGNGLLFPPRLTEAKVPLRGSLLPIS